MPMPSGIIRMNSSRDPGRMVGLTTPTVPRQLVYAIQDSFCIGNRIFRTLAEAPRFFNSTARPVRLIRPTFDHLSKL